MVSAQLDSLIHSIHQPINEAVVEALIQIKNSLIGHDHRKEDAIRHGLISPLISIITSCTSNTRPDSSALLTDLQRPVSLAPVHRQAALHAVIILASLAATGPQAVHPLMAGNVVEHLLAFAVAQHGHTHNDSEVAKQVFRALRNLAVSWSRYVSIDDGPVTQQTTFFTADSYKSFSVLLPLLDDNVKRARQRDQMICDIITHVSRTPQGRQLLIKNKISEWFGKRLHLIQKWSRQPAYKTSPLVDDEIVSYLKATDSLLIGGQTGDARHCQDMLLQRVPSDHALLPTAHNGRKSPFTPDRIRWLFDTARKVTGLPLLMTIRLTARACKLAFFSRSSPDAQADNKALLRALQLNIVPMAVELIQESQTKSALDARTDPEIAKHACSVLAELITLHTDLQAAAADAGAIRTVCLVLRHSFDKVTVAPPYWQPAKSDIALADQTCQLGKSGLAPELVSVMMRRAGALRALAALSDREDKHRKAIIESGVISCIVNSLKPIQNNVDAAAKLEGNTISVILAACLAAQSLSRSVSLLRTSLIDAGIARPIFDLLTHPHHDIQVAATDVCVNLLLDVSPMRDELTKCGVLDILCRHAKEGSPALKRSSLWALKHSVLEASVEQKKKIFTALGVEWLASTISGKPESQRQGGVSLRSANAAGDRVDLLNPSSMDVDEAPPSQPTEVSDEDGELYYDEASGTHYHSSSIRSTLAQSGPPQSSPTLEDQEPALKAQRESVALQRQALDFIRNLLNGETCSEMLAYVFELFSQQRLYRLLTEKLEPIHGSSTIMDRPSPTHGGQVNGPVYHPTEVVVAAIHVAIHIANGGTRDKDHLISHGTYLLKAILPHFSHPRAEVRVMCVWLIHSLTWKEAEYDGHSRRNRARQLNEMGIYRAVQELERDTSLDVRDRVKVVIRHFQEA